jgi:hypothetical protein
VGITADASDTLHPEVKLFQFIHAVLITPGKASGFKKRHNKAAEAAVNMHANTVRLGEVCKSGNRVLVSVGKVYSRAYKLNELNKPNVVY